MSAGDVVFISGATGVFAAAINGAYDRSQEMCGGFSLYIKRGDSSMCIEHFASRMLWQVKRVSVKGQSNSYAYVQGGCALDACTGRQWLVAFDNTAHSEAPCVKMVTGAEANRQGGVVMNAIAAENSRAAAVCFMGASGTYAAEINGVFEPTPEKGLDSRVLYVKRGDASVIIEHHGGFWRVTHASYRGKNSTYAHVSGGVALGDCRCLVWDAWDGTAYVAAPGLRICLEAEVSRIASPHPHIISRGDPHPVVSSFKSSLWWRMLPPLAPSSAPAACVRIVRSHWASPSRSARSESHRRSCGFATKRSARCCYAAALPCLRWLLVWRVPSTVTAAGSSAGSCPASQCAVSASTRGGFGLRYSEGPPFDVSRIAMLATPRACSRPHIPALKR